MLFTILLYQGWAISKISCYNISNYHDNQYYHNVIIANYNSVISIKIVNNGRNSVVMTYNPYV